MIEDVEFTREKWEEFGITLEDELRFEHFIKSGDLYFKPGLDFDVFVFYPNVSAQLAMRNVPLEIHCPEGSF
eukprot:214636-Prymnesium_polylepis.1